MLLKLTLLLLALFSFILPHHASTSNSNQSTINDNLRDFISCLSNFSDHSSNNNPISPNLIYTQLANSSSFQSVLFAYTRNLRFATPQTPRPLAIVTPSHESHVQATVVCARTHALQLRIRSGGHDYEGLSYVSQVPFVVLDMFNLRNIDIDVSSETAWVQTGATIGELYYNIANRSRVHAFPAGVCATVGVGGHISGGGYGNLLRMYGLTVDNVIDARIVNVNGQILDRNSMGEDLFWAVRGGGGASFGVILSYKIRLVRVPETVTVFDKGFLLSQGATDVFYQWEQVAPQLPREIFIRTNTDLITINNSTTRTLRIRFTGMYLGQTDTLIPLLAERLPLLNLTATDCREMTWRQSVLFWDEFPAGTPEEILLNRTRQRVFTKNKSDYVKRIVSKRDLRRIWRLLINAGVTLMQWNPYGGRMSEIPESEVPFPHRAGNLFKIQYIRNWEDDSDTRRNLETMRAFYQVMAPYVSSHPREAFLNYRDLDIGSNPSNETDFKRALVYGRKYFRGNFERLTKVKAEVDPHNFFKNEQSIPPKYWH